MWIDNVLGGIKAEMAAASEFEEFVVRKVEQDGSIRKVFLNLDQAGGRLDDSLEGSEAWWAGPPKGAADVLSVVPEEEQLNLRFVTAPLPPAGQRLRVYPPMYLQKLLDLWERPDHASRFLDWWHTIHSANRRVSERAASATPALAASPPTAGLRTPGLAHQFSVGTPGHRQDRYHRRAAGNFSDGQSRQTRSPALHHQQRGRSGPDRRR